MQVETITLEVAVAKAGVAYEARQAEEKARNEAAEHARWVKRNDAWRKELEALLTPDQRTLLGMTYDSTDGGAWAVLRFKGEVFHITNLPAYPECVRIVRHVTDVDAPNYSRYLNRANLYDEVLEHLYWVDKVQG
ncbi:MAG: hypothetical protein JWP44_4530 [Mucilaginibacter sp.]|nr:hypothetical protein [Mucilaginibacter sp.]